MQEINIFSNYIMTERNHLHPDTKVVWEEEDLLVYAELDENVDLSSCRSAHVLGVDSAQPLLQLDDNFFQGKYVPALGTYMFFEPDENARSTDQLFDRLPEKNLRYVCKCSKLINCSRVYLNPKDGQEPNVVETTVVPEDKANVHEFSTLEEVLVKFESAYKENETNQNSKNLNMSSILTQ